MVNPQVWSSSGESGKLSPVKILLSNDDGVTAPGLHQMADALKRLGDVYICAPEGPRSGASSALTLYSPLLVTEVGLGSGPTAAKVPHERAQRCCRAWWSPGYAGAG